jgi:hypothetical protein
LFELRTALSGFGSQCVMSPPWPAYLIEPSSHCPRIVHMYVFVASHHAFALRQVAACVSFTGTIRCVSLALWGGRCARRFPLSVAGSPFVPWSVGMRPRPKGTARYRSRPRVLGSTLPPTTPFQNSPYHSSLHIISNMANSPVRIDKSGAQIRAQCA